MIGQPGFQPRRGQIRIERIAHGDPQGLLKVELKGQPFGQDRCVAGAQSPGSRERLQRLHGSRPDDARCAPCRLENCVLNHELDIDQAAWRKLHIPARLGGSFTRHAPAHVGDVLGDLWIGAL